MPKVIAERVTASIDGELAYIVPAKEAKMHRVCDTIRAIDENHDYPAAARVPGQSRKQRMGISSEPLRRQGAFLRKHAG